MRGEAHICEVEQLAINIDWGNNPERTVEQNGVQKTCEAHGLLVLVKFKARQGAAR